MKRNKSYLFILLLIVMLIFGVAAQCSLCKILLGEEMGIERDPQTFYSSTDSSIATSASITTETAKPLDKTPVHGMVPVIVTGHASGDTKENGGTLEFWNVGGLGPREYSKASYTINKDGKAINTFKGYFTGGPDGEFFLDDSSGKQMHGKLENGFKYVGIDGEIIYIDNPQAFDDYIDDTAKEVMPDKEEPDSNLIHGVLPTKVTGTSTGNSKSGWIGILEFWNVGKLGGEQYAKATYIMTLNGKTTSTWEGYFTGGPNGDFYLSGENELHGKLEEGKSVVSESGGIATIDNPEAFDGWKD